MYPVWVRQAFLDLQYVHMQHARCLRLGIFLREKECLGEVQAGIGGWEFPPSHHIQISGYTAGLPAFLAGGRLYIFRYLIMWTIVLGKSVHRVHGYTVWYHVSIYPGYARLANMFACDCGLQTGGGDLLAI